MSFDVAILASSTVGKDGIVEVTTSFLEEYYNVSRAALTDWTKKGCPQLSRGKWDFIAVLKWRGGLEAFEADSEDSNKNLVAEKLKAEIFLKQQQGQLAEIELQKARGEVIEIEQVKEVVGSVIINTKTLFLSLPAKVAPKLIGLSVLDELVKVLQEHSACFIKAKTSKDADIIINKIIEEFSQAKTVMEINDIVSYIVHDILSELSAIKIGKSEGDAV